MAKCTFHLEQPLPPICLCCGADATHYSRQSFLHSNPWLLWTAALGTWYYNLVKLQIPLCDAHRNRLRHRWVGPFLFLVGSAAAIVLPWAIYSSLYGREASNAATGVVIIASLVAAAIFYAWLLYVSFSRPHVCDVQGDHISLRCVSDRFAAVVSGAGEPLMVAELADGPPLAALASAPVRASATPRRRTGAGWVIILSAIMVLLLFLGCGVFGYGVYTLATSLYSPSPANKNASTTTAPATGASGFNPFASTPLALQASVQSTTYPQPGPTVIRIEHRRSGELDPRKEYNWTVAFDERRLQPRRMTAAQLQIDGAITLTCFDVQSGAIEIWIEEATFDQGAPRRVSSIASLSLR